MKSIIFLGPSLPVEEARQILDAIYLPPAGQTDMLTATVNCQPDVIGLIDGVFLQSLSVWHKEILYALDRGILVYGSSSMGAIRAAGGDAGRGRQLFVAGCASCHGMTAQGVSQQDTLPTLVLNAAPYFGKEMSEPELLSKRAVRDGNVEVGTPVVVPMPEPKK